MNCFGLVIRTNLSNRADGTDLIGLLGGTPAGWGTALWTLWTLQGPLRKQPQSQHTFPAVILLQL